MAKGGLFDVKTDRQIFRFLFPEQFKEHAGEEKAGAVISLKKEDLEKLEKGFLQELKEKVKSGITLKSTADISGGFTISFDSGKSHLDFTDHALAEYLSSLLKPKLAELLKEIAK